MKPFIQEAEIFKALMHPARLAILNELRSDEHCVCHLEACLGLRQAYISQQLMVLREAGLIEDRRVGWNIFYRVVEPAVFQLLDMAHAISGESEVHMSEQEREGLQSKACPCPKCNPEKATGRC
jgi:ArsR family transcriptional regulator